MKTITVYEVEGKRFDREEDAQAYEHLCQRVRKVMSLLKPRTQEVEDCLAYLEHDKEELNTALSLLMGICGEVIPSWKEWFDQVAKGEITPGKLRWRGIKIVRPDFGRFDKKYNIEIWQRNELLGKIEIEFVMKFPQ